jgi:hypothetical protein
MENGNRPAGAPFKLGTVPIVISESGGSARVVDYGEVSGENGARPTSRAGQEKGRFAKVPHRR